MVPEAGREIDEDDHDLLTFHESGVRLGEEIAATRTAVGEAADDAGRALLQARLAALEAALERNSRFAATRPGEAGFLTYEPPSSRPRA